MPVTYETSTDGTLFPVFPASSPEEQAQAMAFQQQRDALRGQGLSPHQASIQAWARVMPGRSFPGTDTLPGGIPFHPRPPLKEWVPWGPISGWTLVLFLSAIGCIAARHRLRRPTRFAPWFGLWALFEGIFLVLYRLQPRLANGADGGKAFFDSYTTRSANQLVIDRGDATFLDLTVAATVVVVLSFWTAKALARRNTKNTNLVPL